MSVTAGLKCAPEIGPNVKIKATSAAPVGAPNGSYLLLYPLMERGVPMEPGRYFTGSNVACWSWSLSAEGCMTVERLPPSWARTRTLAPFVVEPTTLRTLSHGGGSYTVPSNATVGSDPKSKPLLVRGGGSGRSTPVNVAPPSDDAIARIGRRWISFDPVITLRVFAGLIAMNVSLCDPHS